MNTQNRWIIAAVLIVAGLILIAGLLITTSNRQASVQQYANQTQASDTATHVVATLTAQAPP